MRKENLVIYVHTSRGDKLVSYPITIIIVILHTSIGIIIFVFEFIYFIINRSDAHIP